MAAENPGIAEGVLFTDLYQLTMAQVYFRQGLHESRAQFDHFFRSYPDYGEHKAGYCINAGLETLLEWMQTARFRDKDLEPMGAMQSRSGKPLFQDDFLKWLKAARILDSVSLQAIPEGRVVHPNVPLTVVKAPLALAQILETALLSHLNYQTLIATKASRVRLSGQGRLLLEFGARRAHAKGALDGARGALIGGADFTSNTGVSFALGFPPKGTHAHSMVQAFMALGGSELDAFRAYAEVYPDDCLLLVDTVDTLNEGVPNAIKVFEELRRKGHRPVGIRLDSGDLAHLSIQARKMLDQAGFTEAKIVLSNQLDEMVLMQILTQVRDEAPGYGVDADKLIERFLYGVGTRLITSRGDSALDGVYKLVAVEEGGDWKPAIKLSETPAKVPNPGPKKVWRVYDERRKAMADLIGEEDEDPEDSDPLVLRHPVEEQTLRKIDRSRIADLEPLLVQYLEDGRRATEAPAIEEMRNRREQDLKSLDAGVKRIMNPHRYHVSLTEQLWNLKQRLVASAEPHDGRDGRAGASGRGD
ncbi:MAG: nicotinate phosphoribosyltransferase [Candidatus Eisenbacteria bacterium]|nr:nicotinate phosphoribosyltransferase [Candidatus Eisenbacteria bacterium]